MIGCSWTRPVPQGGSCCSITLQTCLSTLNSPALQCPHFSFSDPSDDDQPWDPSVQGLCFSALTSPCAAAVLPLWTWWPSGSGTDPEPPPGAAVGHINLDTSLPPGSPQALLHMLGQCWCDTARDTEMRVGANLWGHQTRHGTKIQL